jgi:GntR family transcriptional regulator
MRFWFVHSGEVSIREQIVTQVVLGILSDELSPGERLPSTRELARRFQLHPNTVSGAYRQLQSEGWLESRHGSGVFVRSTRPSATSHSHTPAQLLDRIFANFLNSTRRMKIPLADVRQRLQQWIGLPERTHFLLLEPDPSLRQIVLHELRDALRDALHLPIVETWIEDPSLAEKLLRAIPVVLPSKVPAVRPLLPPETELLILQIRPPSSSLAQWLPAPSDALIGIASAWTQFLDIARTMLIAAGFSHDTLVLRDTGDPRWSDGLDQTAAVVCDSLTASLLPAHVRAIPFALLAQTTVEELRRHSLAAASAAEIPVPVHEQSPKIAASEAADTSPVAASSGSAALHSRSSADTAPRTGPRPRKPAARAPKAQPQVLAENPSPPQTPPPAALPPGPYRSASENASSPAVSTTPRQSPEPHQGDT